MPALLDLLPKLCHFLSAERGTFTTTAGRFCLEKCREEFTKLIAHNVNCYELHYADFQPLASGLWFANNSIEYLEQYLADPEKLLPRWCSPREPDIQKMTDDFEDELAEITKKLTTAYSRFKEYAQYCLDNKLHPNDPVARINHCLQQAVHETTLTNASIHQFNWARHLKSLAICAQCEKGYEFQPAEALRELEIAMRQAETHFFQIKDDLSGRNQISHRRLKKSSAAGRPSLQLMENEKPPARSAKINKNLVHLRTIFEDQAARFAKVTCQIIAPPKEAGYWNKRMDGSWLLERDEPLRRSHAIYEGVSRTSRLHRMPSAGISSPVPSPGKGRPSSASPTSGTKNRAQNTTTSEAATTAITAGRGGLGD